MKNNQEYWQKKIGFYLHDPVDKALGIPGHEARAQKIADALGGAVSKDAYQRADSIASGLDRAGFPGYSKDAAKNGAVDFQDQGNAVFNHPFSSTGKLAIEGVSNCKAGDSTEKVAALINKDTGNAVENWSRQEYFFYLFFHLKNRLITKNTGDLGTLWSLLPADTRIPDHAIWNHLALTSALGSSFALSESKNASIVVYSLGPVQPFIAKTRKLRDHWTASVILSWLSFEGMCTVMEELGPDHILYPSLHGQPLVREYLKRNYTRDSGAFRKFMEEAEGSVLQGNDTTIAAFPNKFVFLAPAGREQEYTDMISARIDTQWADLATLVSDSIAHAVGNRDYEGIFRRQTTAYWQKNWGCCNLLDLHNRIDIATLYDPDTFEKLITTSENFAKGYPGSPVLYSPSHALAQGANASAKQKTVNNRPDEPGGKCPVCGEFEILHGHTSTEWASAHEYQKAMNAFWNKLKNHYGEITIRENETLCSICAIKRLVSLAIKNKEKDHILASIFADAHTFPTTTEIALHEFFAREGIVVDNERREMIEHIHNATNDEDENTHLKKIFASAKEKVNETDRYYAILIMDGDKMGDLVNGETVAARWKDVIHPDLIERYENGTLTEKKELWYTTTRDKNGTKMLLDEKRILSPHLHSTISDTLGNFALHAVPAIIKKYHGRLIYAGGDDVVAILPLTKALRAAQEIRTAYNTPFASLENGDIVPAEKARPDNLVMMLPGTGEHISISASLLYVHDKQPLRGALEEAHTLLTDEAKSKSKGDRNAIVQRLKKRSGQSRDFVCKWDAPNVFATDDSTMLDAFTAISEYAKQEQMSTSLIYNLAGLEVMLKNLLPESKKTPADNTLTQEQKNKIIQIVHYEVKHSGVSTTFDTGQTNTMARCLAGLLLQQRKNGTWAFTPDVPVIARYLGKGAKK